MLIACEEITVAHVEAANEWVRDMVRKAEGREASVGAVPFSPPGEITASFAAAEAAKENRVPGFRVGVK